MIVRWLMPLTAAACLLVIATGLTRMNRVESGVDAASHQLRNLQQDAQRILDLRAARATVSLDKKPKADIIARISDTLTDAGIPSNVLGNVGAGTETPMPVTNGPPISTQSVRFTLEPITTRQLGSFLDRWRSEQQIWSVTQMELTTSARPSDQAASYSARFTIEAIYIAQDSQP